MLSQNIPGTFCVYRSIRAGMSEITQSALERAKAVRYRFSTFELEVGSGELRRSGVKVRLQDQPFLVLRKLLEGAGTLVTREELHAALWPADTFVDFDTGLNTAIKRLREVLGDSADIPVFIETVPRRGYRFVAPVQSLSDGVSLPLPAQTEVPPARARRVRLGLLVGGLLLCAAIGGSITGLRSAAPLPRVLDWAQITFDGMEKGNLRVRGGQIHFNEQEGNRITVIKVPVVGGPPTVLDSSYPGLYLRDVSGDGKKLLVVSAPASSTGLYRLKIMDLGAGSLQDVDGVACSDVSWAPGGKILLAKDQDLFLADADGSNQHKLLSASGPVFYMRFSPDGTRLRFTVGSKGTSRRSIWETRADGTGLHEVLTNKEGFTERCCGEWSVDGRYYFFEAIRDGATRIWALPEHHSFWNARPVPVALTTGPLNSYMGGPSPDGKKLIITAAQPRAELVRYDSLSHQFVPFLSGISAGDVEASHDGSLFVYVRYPEEALWRSNFNGTEAAQLTGPSLRASLPHFSPDGRRIAFSGSREGGPWNLFLISATGGPAEQISNGSVSDLDATWSPDSSTVAFGQTRMEAGREIVSIQLLDLATRRAARLAGSDGICCPRWSPDGRYLLASHSDYQDLLLYEFETHKWTVIVKGLGSIGYMEWSNNGKQVLFDTFEAAEPAFYRLRLSDLHLETVTSLSDVRRYYGQFGPWTGMAPDGSPLLARDIGIEEVYSLDLLLP
jgi:Tol biopolymer transport system component/DNA-binding winged helix-turn-helix (wHTH) protein